jgi:hypothetical protein
MYGWSVLLDEVLDVGFIKHLACRVAGVDDDDDFRIEIFRNRSLVLRLKFFCGDPPLFVLI